MPFSSFRQKRRKKNLDAPAPAKRDRAEGEYENEIKAKGQTNRRRRRRSQYVEHAIVHYHRHHDQPDHVHSRGCFTPSVVTPYPGVYTSLNVLISLLTAAHAQLRNVNAGKVHEAHCKREARISTACSHTQKNQFVHEILPADATATDPQLQEPVRDKARLCGTDDE